jgi:hypothetical protein
MITTLDVTTKKGIKEAEGGLSEIAKNAISLAALGLPLPWIWKKLSAGRPQPVDQVESLKELLPVARKSGVKKLRVVIAKEIRHDGEVELLFKKFINIKQEWDYGKKVALEVEFK